MNPYEADPIKIPANDPYSREPFFGRYLPRVDDFQVDKKHIRSEASESLDYWSSVLAKCDSSTILFDNPWGGRDVFAVGSVIVKSSHRKNVSRDHLYSDRNEVEATNLAKSALLELGVMVPQFYFAGQIDGRATLIQERIPGVGLNVAWPYLSPGQKQSFKQQARRLLQSLRKVKTLAVLTNPSYVVPDPNPVQNRGIQEAERDILFGQAEDRNTDLCLMHNDFQPSNIIVNNDKIVGLIDWEMAGYFSWNAAKEVHLEIRMPRREDFANAKLSEDKLADILFWNDVYEENQ